MTRLVKIGAVVLIALVVGGILCKKFVFTEERRIVKTLKTLEKLINKPLAGGLDAAILTASLKSFFASDVLIYMDMEEFPGGGMGISKGGLSRDEFVGTIGYEKQQNPALTITMNPLGYGKVIESEREYTAVNVSVSIENFIDNPSDIHKNLLILFVKDEDQKLRIGGFHILK